MLDVIKDTLIDGIKLLPFLFITYLLMEYIEHKMGKKSKELIKKSDKFGPFFGAFLGAFPQCGFSVSATNLYSARLITLGTLIAVYLSTSDEMLPIFISESVDFIIIVKILFVKLLIGMMIGFFIDFFVRLIRKNKNKDFQENEQDIKEFCEEEHCHCNESGIFKSALKHTINIFIFITIITFAINTLIHFIGEETIEKAIAGVPVLGILVSSIFGLIPNCAGSVIITELYLSNLISFGSMIAGLLVGSGIGILVLFKSNKNIKENLTITGLLMLVGIIVGLIIDFVI
mgnify:CR=1 FL=1